MKRYKPQLDLRSGVAYAIMQESPEGGYVIFDDLPQVETEELPNDNRDVLCLTVLGECRGFFEDGRWLKKVGDGCFIVLDDVISWQELPNWDVTKC
jgi:hypothetical protein